MPVKRSPAQLGQQGKTLSSKQKQQKKKLIDNDDFSPYILIFRSKKYFQPRTGGSHL
jgi:hypothetical protein